MMSGGQSQSAAPAYLALMAATLFWAGNFVIGRAVSGMIDPIFLNCMRWCVALLLFLPFAAASLGRSWPALCARPLWILALGVTGVACFNTFVYIALEDTKVLNALLLLSSMPAVIMVAAAVAERAPPSAGQALGGLLSLGGALVLIAEGSLDALLALALSRSDFWVLGAVAAWSVYTLLVRAGPKGAEPNAVLLASMIVGAPLLVAVTFYRAPDVTMLFSAQPSPELWAAVLYISIFASLVSLSCWNFGVRRIGPARAGQFIHLMPVFGAGLAALFLGEAVRAYQGVGAALVFGGVVLVNRGARPKRNDAEKNAAPRPRRALPSYAGCADGPTMIEDRSFYREHYLWLAVIWLSLFLALGAMIGVPFLVRKFTVATIEEAAIAAGGALAIYLFITIIAEIQIGHALQVKLGEIRKTARIGCERMRIDDETLVRGAVRDVLAEWMHIHFFLRHLREAGGWFILFVVLQCVAAVGLLAALWPLAPPKPEPAAILFGAAMLLIVFHLFRQIALVRRRSRRQGMPDELNPTEVLATRMIGLIDEVKQLRRRES